MTQETYEESGDRQAEDRVGLLTFVLCFDDLLALNAARSVVLDRPLTVVVRRAGGVLGLEDARDTFAVRDRWLSSPHFELTVAADGAARLADLGSKNGTFVNGARITTHTLASGDVIDAGHSWFVYRTIARGSVESSGEVWIGPTRTLSPEMIALARRLPVIAASDEPVLIVGATGTGKEIVAAEIHRAGRPAEQLVRVDAARLEDGSFDDAALDAVRGGSVFVSEVGGLSAAAQLRLLRMLDRPRAPSGPVPRWITATNSEPFVDSPVLRADLLHRLSGYLIRLPPLRARSEDLGRLVAYFLESAGITRASITVAAARALFLDAFPGNLRQLRSAIAGAARLAGEGAIDVQHLPQLEPPAPEAAPEPPAERPPEAPPAPAHRAKEEDDTPRFRLDGDYWTVEHAGKPLLLADAMGLRYIAHLLQHPGRELHVLDLTISVRGGMPEDAAGAGGDAGPMLDRAAKQAYERRLEALSAELEDATRCSDLHRATRAREEIETLAEELARSFGLGGRDRKAASAAERARINITQHIKRAIKKIEAQDPALGHQLAACIKTGVFCVYAPPPRAR